MSQIGPVQVQVFFAGVKVTKTGQWESCVVRAASTRLM